MSLVVIGLNHRTVPLDLLERVSITDGGIAKALHDLTTRDNVTEAVVISTCNRTEIYAYAERFHGAYQDIRDFLSDLASLPPEDFSDHLYSFHDTEATRHLFSVASGLDSAVLGEHEILGQVKRAWEAAQHEQAVGSLLNPLFRHALEVGKRARTDTSIAQNVASVSQAAVAMATDRLGSLRGRRVLVCGAGEMGDGMAKALQAAGIAELVIANRTWETACAVADRVGGRAVRLTDLGVELATADVLLTSTGATSVILEQHDVDALMADRAGKELLIVDIAVPRDVDPAVGQLDGVSLLDMDDLRRFAAQGVEQRRREVAAVERIVDAELDRYVNVSASRTVDPIVRGLRDRAEQIRSAELDRFAGKLRELEPREREAVEALVAGVVGKLLHEPTVRLKDAAGSARGERLAEAVRDLYDLGSAEPDL